MLASRDKSELSFTTQDIEFPEIIGKSLGTAFSPDSKLLSGLTEQRDVVLMDASTGSSLSTIPMSSDSLPSCMFRVHDVVFTSDGRILLTVCNNSLHAWNINALEKPVFVFVFEILIGNATTFALSPAGTYLIGGEFEGTVDIFSVPSGKLLAQRAGHTQPARGTRLWLLRFLFP
jgi:WD40 repeat protein